MQPAPFFALFWGLEPRALTPKSILASAPTSRIAPKIITPDQPLFAPIAAIMSPSSAEPRCAPPSTTSTSPSEGVSSTWRNRTLSSRHLTVRMRPQNSRRPPYCLNCVSHELQRFMNASYKSDVENCAFTVHLFAGLAYTDHTAFVLSRLERPSSCQRTPRAGRRLSANRLRVALYNATRCGLAGL